jgi:Domain of unknown function (DUF4263)
MNNMIAWRQLSNAPVLSQIVADWLALLSDTTKREQDYQAFLRNHAGMFFPGIGLASPEQIVLEKTALGSDYITDFVNVNNNRSYGFTYTLIEIESPHDLLYTQSGGQTSALNVALQQVREWKQWITANMDTAKRLFPSKQFLVTGVPSINYMVIIGRRQRDKAVVEKRNQIKRDEGIEVRSFDYLTDVLMSKTYTSYTAISRDLIPITKEQNNQFSNPFYIAISDATWRYMLNGFRHNYSHMIGQNIDVILASRQYNTQRCDEFLHWVQQGANNTIHPMEEQRLLMT